MDRDDNPSIGKQVANFLEISPPPNELCFIPGPCFIRGSMRFSALYRYQYGLRSVFNIILCASLAICLVGPCQATVDADEVAALQSILNAFPALATVNLAVQRSMNNINVTRNWSVDLTTVCSGPDGYDLFGIHCSFGHVDKILWYASFCIDIHTIDY